MMNMKRMSVIAAVVLSAALAAVSCGPRQESKPFVVRDEVVEQGKTITLPGLPAGEQNQWLAFRKDFSIDKVPSQAPARIAVDSKYWLWINGKMVVFEGQLKRGPARGESYFDEVDIAPFLTVEEDGTLIQHPASRYTTAWEGGFTTGLVPAWQHPETMADVCKEMAQMMNDVLATE